MASSIASPVYQEGPQEIYLPKQTAIDKIGGIYCHICNTTFGNKKDFDSHYSKHITGGGDIVYTCVACKKQFIGYPSFRGHCYIKHVVKNKFQCNLCPKSFAKQAILNSHIVSVHEFKCSQCDEKFSSKKDLELHKVVHMNKSREEPPYDCFSCGKAITSVDICEGHIDDHCQTLYPCPICNKVLPNKLEATKHLTVHFNEALPEEIVTTPTTASNDSSIDILGGILCCHCDLLFKNRTEFDNHFALEHEDNTIVYTCHICGKQYETYLLFGNHCYFHISKDKFQCDECEKTFPRLSLLVIHTDSFHKVGASEKPYQCDTCGHSFKARYRLFKHMRTVHGDNTIKCPEQGCTAVFDCPKDLVLHQKEHKRLSDNWCRKCGLRFVSLASCEKHLDVHKLTQYSCPVCNREYREKYLMVKHIPQHFESVLHICKVCGKTYNARNRLMQHAKTHSDQRAYKCTYCPKSFFKPNELQQHINLHTGQRPYECAYCPKTFASYPNWNKHLTRVHNTDKTEIKKLKLARDAKMNKKSSTDAKSSPVAADSGTGSASSEIDVYSFAESDDSLSRGPYQEWAIENPQPLIENIDMFDMNTIRDPNNGNVMSLTDTVNAVIDRIDCMDDNLNHKDENGDLTQITNISDEFTSTFKPLDDSSDIKAIVEHIDAMSGDLETTADNFGSVGADVAALDTTDIKDIMQFAEMLPVNSAMFETDNQPMIEPTYMPANCPTGYGLDFVQSAPDMYQDGLMNLDHHIMQPIDPLLTTTPEDNIFTQTFPYQTNTEPLHYMQNNWEPMITKVFNYDEPNDNRMYVMNSNIF